MQLFWTAGSGQEAELDDAKARHVDVSAIPVIDVAALSQGGKAERAVGLEMLCAAEGIGFFYIRNCAIPQTLIAQVFDISRQFFSALPAEKARVAVNAGHRGFIRVGEAKMSDKAQPDLKESFIWGLDAPGPDGIPPNQWPDFLPGMRKVLTDFFAVGNAVGWQLLRAVAAALDLDPESFVRTIDRPISRGSIIYYPEQPDGPEPERFGVSSHTDYGCLTLLYQDDAGGLQVQGRSGEWLAAPPIAGTFVVNVGDLLARWSNDQFRSTPHRVINRSGRTGYSTALFVDPNRDTMITPVTRPGEEPRYPPVTCGEYLRSRLDAAFDYRKRAAEQAPA